jgi:hypothetical protein
MQVKIENCGVLADGGAVMIIAEEPTGERHIHERGDLTVAEAGRLSDRVEAAGVIDLARWFYTYPRYGSPAYEDEVASACDYAESLRAGFIHEDEVPYPYSTLL